MTQKNENYLSMASATLQILHANQAVWSGQAIFSKIVGEIDADVKSINNALGLAGTKSTGATASKWQAAEKAINRAVKYSGLAQIHALEVGNTLLFNQLNTSASQLERLPDQQLTPALQNIYTNINALKNVLEPYGISEHELNLLQADIEAFKNNKDQPRVVIVERKGYNNSMPTLLSEIKTSFFKLDRLIKLWESSNDKFISDYENARKVIPLGTRHKKNDLVPPIG